MSDEDAVLAFDQVQGGIIRALTARPDDCPDCDRDPRSTGLTSPGVTQTSCSYSCSQTYSSKTKAVGHFTINYRFDRGTISNTPVTTLTVTKTANP
jgi:hypothetical protein